MNEKEIWVHSQTMLALGEELDEIIEKLSNNELEYDADADYRQSEISGVYPCYGLYVASLSPQNYHKLSAESEYSLVRQERLWLDYEDLADYAKAIKCKELVAFAEKFLAFIKEQEANIPIREAITKEKIRELQKELNAASERLMNGDSEAKHQVHEIATKLAELTKNL